MSHRSTEKSDGMFATVVVVLPSAYTGGQVHVSHGHSTKVIDVSSSSLLRTSVLAWYTDVMHEVKPITSGYRLALSYNLLHTSKGVPRPSLPNMHGALMRLRHVLRRWYEGAYKKKCDQDTRYIAYITEHEYSAANLMTGQTTLKGEDAHKISHVRQVAEELGFVVYLGNLSYNVSGVADYDGGDYGYYGHKRRRHCYSHSDEPGEDDVSMGEIHEKTYSLTNIVDIDGEPLSDELENVELLLKENLIVPQDAFEDAEPDEREYEGYMGNVCYSFSTL